MKNERILLNLTDVKDKYVLEAAPGDFNTSSNRKNERPFWRSWGTVAVCLCLVMLASFWLSSGSRQNTSGIISQYKGNTNDKIAIPAPGEYFCYPNVNNARKYYEGQDVQYLLSFKMYKNGGKLLSDEEKAIEYQRLAGLGYELYQTEKWVYTGAGEKKYQIIVVGLFTENELSNFNANSEYGYTFRFEENGDGSAVPIEESKRIGESNNT